MTTRLTMVVPTYQERENIAPFVRSVFACVPGAGILVVDDNSPDGTADAVRDLAREYSSLQLLSRPNKDGLGRAYIAGFKYLLERQSADLIGMIDADFSHDPAAIPRMMERARTYDFVVGSRYTKGGAIDGWERWRYGLSSGGNLYSRLVTGMPLADATSGYNLIRADFLRRLPFSELKASGYAFQIELKYRMWKIGASLWEEPITFHQRRGGESKITNHIIYEGIIAPWRLRLGGRHDA